MHRMGRLRRPDRAAPAPVTGAVGWSKETITAFPQEAAGTKAALGSIQAVWLTQDASKEGLAEHPLCMSCEIAALARGHRNVRQNKMGTVDWSEILLNGTRHIERGGVSLRGGKQFC